MQNFRDFCAIFLKISKVFQNLQNFDFSQNFQNFKEFFAQNFRISKVFKNFGDFFAKILEISKVLANFQNYRGLLVKISRKILEISRKPPPLRGVLRKRIFTSTSKCTPARPVGSHSHDPPPVLTTNPRFTRTRSRSFPLSRPQKNYQKLRPTLRQDPSSCPTRVVLTLSLLSVVGTHISLYGHLVLSRAGRGGSGQVITV